MPAIGRIRKTSDQLIQCTVLSEILVSCVSALGLESLNESTGISFQCRCYAHYVDQAYVPFSSFQGADIGKVQATSLS